MPEAGNTNVSDKGPGSKSRRKLFLRLTAWLLLYSWAGMMLTNEIHGIRDSFIQPTFYG